MWTRDLLKVTGVAVATTMLTVGSLWPTGVVAEEQARPAEQAKVEVPTLNVDGIAMSIKPIGDKLAIENGMPASKVRIVNTTDDEVAFTASVVIETTPAAARFSRRMILPNEAWKDSCNLVLTPGEEKELEYEADVKLEAGAMVRVKMVSGERAVYAATATVTKQVQDKDGAEAEPDNTVVLKLNAAAQR